jgi:hypothetical protein
MKIMRKGRLIDVGGFSATEKWIATEKDTEQAIHSVQWPPGSGSFTLFDESGKKRGQGNGVKPIKEECMEKLRSLGWALQTTLDIATLKRAGAIDATRDLGGRYFALEWETGNISSSHRALNKMALGLIKGVLVGGVLIVPTREMYKYLTDRVGNFAELEPYFSLWGALRVQYGLLEVVAIEHDGVSRTVPRIPKGTEGRALQ